MQSLPTKAVHYTTEWSRENYRHLRLRRVQSSVPSVFCGQCGKTLIIGLSGNYVSSNSPTLSPSEEATLDRIMAYVDDLGLFSSELPSKRRTIAKGIFVAVLNDWEAPGQVLSPQKVVTTFSLQLYPTPTTASYCPSMTVTYPYATPPTTEEVVSIQNLDLLFKS